MDTIETTKTEETKPTKTKADIAIDPAGIAPFMKSRALYKFASTSKKIAAYLNELGYTEISEADADIAIGGAGDNLTAGKCLMLAENNCPDGFTFFRQGPDYFVFKKAKK
jgi:hypothetical protein